MIDAAPGRGGVRVLHLIDPPEAEPIRGATTHRGCAELDAALCAAVIASTPHLSHQVLILGSDRAARWARAFGLPGDSRVGIGPGRGRVGLAIRRFVRACGRFDVLQAWSERTSHAIRGFPGASPLAPAMQALTGQILVPSPDTSGQESVPTRASRDRLGVDPRDRLVGLISWSRMPPDAAKGRWVCSLASTMGERSTLVVSDQSDGIARAMRMGDRLGDGVGMIVLGGPVLPRLWMCDAALCVDLPSSPEDLVRAGALARATRGVPVAVGTSGSEAWSDASAPMPCRTHIATRAGAPSLGEALARALADTDQTVGMGTVAAGSVSIRCPDRMLDLWTRATGVGGGQPREGVA